VLRQTSTTALEKALGGVSLREQAIADNIANAETPGYRPRRVSFEEALRAAVQHETGNTSPPVSEVIEDVTPRVRREPATERWGVTVDLEREMVDLARTNFQHEAMARMLGKAYRMLRSAITGGSQS
jgi:flagellar basal-body rod protein FlgB